LKPILFLIIFLISLSEIHAQHTYAFFGSFNRDQDTEGLFVYELDTLSGKLSKVSSFTGMLNPSFLTVSPNGKYVFACTESKTENGGSVSSFAFDPEKKSLTLISKQKSGGENPVYLTVHPDGKWLVNGNYTEGSVSVYPVSENGQIQPYVRNFQFEEGSIDPNRQERAHIHSTVFSPDFNYIFLPDLGADKIRTYRFETEKDQPLQPAAVHFTATVPGSGPRHLTFHPNGKFAYCIEEMGGAVDVYSYDNGVLNSLQRINTHSDKYRENFEGSDVHVSPDGRFLYASNRGNENNIAIFSIRDDGTLKTVGYQSTKGKHPRVFNLGPDGKFLIATNAGTGMVVVFRRNSETGLLKKVGRKIKIKSVSCVEIRKY
jgi:6-phosphogluconolactonase (cycloisomerase 2 family)